MNPPGIGQKQNLTEVKKLEAMREVIHKAGTKESSSNWRKHVPVYGWTTMNYPSGLRPSLLEKYKPQNKEEPGSNMSKSISKAETINIHHGNKNNDHDESDLIKVYRLDPEIVNEYVIKEIENLIPIDHTQKFMKNYKPCDLKFIKNSFNNFEKNKSGYIKDSAGLPPHNYVDIIEKDSRKFQYKLGYKHALTMLTTDPFVNKTEYVNLNCHFDKKYANMWPKCSMLGPEPDLKFSKKAKKIGDISFEEETNETENVKNLRRLPPDNMTEEWIRDNFSTKVQILNLDNCYWISKSLISKLGRMNPTLQELSLRNLEVDNSILQSILQHTTSLKKLDISYCCSLTRDIILYIASSCPKLEKLYLFGLVKVVDDDSLEEVLQLDYLNTLHIGLCNKITDSGLTSLASKIKDRLVDIDLTGLIRITSVGLSEVINNNANTLISLNISLMPQAKLDGEVCYPIGKCKKLKQLDISGCINMSNSGIQSMFSAGLENLESLNMSGIPKLSDLGGINAISTNKRLRILRMSNCPGLTILTMEYIIGNSCDLILLEINRTPLIPDLKVEEAKLTKAPNLRIIRSTNIVWNMNNVGYKVPLLPKGYVKPMVKGAKKPPAKKNDDKNPVNQLKKLLEEVKPKRSVDFKL